MTGQAECLRADWPAPAKVVAGCTTRQGGASKGRYESLNLAAHVGDDDADVAENRRRFIRECRLPAEPHWLSQVHGNRVLTDPAPEAEGDAILTRRPGTVCAVLTADCLPVLFVSDDGMEVAAAHAGWRGLSAGVLENTVRAFRSPPARLMAWLGPAISQAAFEVGDEVRDAFLDNDAAAADCFAANARGRWQADLYRLAGLRLTNAGVSRVYGGGACTVAESGRYFSYRRDGQCGRMASFVFRYA